MPNELRDEAEAIFDTIEVDTTTSDALIVIKNVFPRFYSNVFTPSQFVEFAKTLYGLRIQLDEMTKALEELRIRRYVRFHSRTDRNEPERHYEIRFRGSR